MRWQPRISWAAVSIKWQQSPHCRCSVAHCTVCGVCSWTRALSRRWILKAAEIIALSRLTAVFVNMLGLWVVIFKGENIGGHERLFTPSAITPTQRWRAEIVCESLWVSLKASAHRSPIPTCCYLQYIVFNTNTQQKQTPLLVKCWDLGSDVQYVARGNTGPCVHSGQCWRQEGLKDNSGVNQSQLNDLLTVSFSACVCVYVCIYVCGHVLM